MPRFFFALAAATCTVVSCPTLVLAQADKAPGKATSPVTSPEVQKLLEQARKSIAELKAMSYTAEVQGAGTLDGKVPVVKAEVSASRADAGGWKLYTKGTSSGADSGKTSFEVSYDGVVAYSNKEKDQTVYESEPSNDGELAVFFSKQGAKHPIVWELIAERPLDLNGGTAELEKAGDAVNDVPCRVLLLHPKPLDVGGDTETQDVRLWLGKEDLLPRKIERLLTTPAGGSRVLTISKLRTDGDSIGAAYTMQVPDGFAVKSPDPKPERKAAPKRGGGGGQPMAQPGALAVGAVAPEFALKDADGKEHKLSEYKGKIVLLDFWATWCGPCRMAMPGVQKIHEKFKDKPVVVIGMNTSENKDPVAYMKEKKFTYGLLLNAETIGDKYNISGIPAFFLIGPDGKLLWQEVGYNPAGEKEATDVIEKTLKGMEK
jgi:thiol-disulfide isomerase/thioredoxin